MTSKKKESTAQRLTRIRSAAFSLAAKREINSISIYDVAKEAEIASSTIYHHFPNIEALMYDLMQEMFIHFEEVLDNAIDGSAVHHWKDINRMIETAFVHHYQTTPLVKNFLFEQHAYMSIHYADAKNDQLLGKKILSLYQQYFDLPPLPPTINIFAIALQLADKVYSMSYTEHGEITKEMAQEAILATEAYLSIYLPFYLPRINE